MLEGGTSSAFDAIFTWDSGNCQQNPQTEDGMYLHVATIEVFAYGDGQCEIRNYEIGGANALLIKDCSGDTSDLLSSGGTVGFGNSKGFNPCLAETPVVEATWGQIKKFSGMKIGP